MENYGYHIIGEILISIGKSLQDDNSEFRKKFRLSREQMMTLIGVIRLAASPDVQRKYLHQVADRFGVSEKTIHNWIDLGILPQGHKTAHDTRHWWYSDELDEYERELIRLGYLKPKLHHRLKYFKKMINGFIH